MKTVQLLTGVFVMGACLFGCSAEKRLGNRLEGQWQIARYNTNDLGSQRVDLSNIGTIDFNNNQTGRRDVTYGLFQNTFVVNREFRWSNTADYVIFNDAVSDSAKAWIIIENRKARQLWKSTNGSGGVQVLELRKPDQKGFLSGSGNK